MRCNYKYKSKLPYRLVLDLLGHTNYSGRKNNCQKIWPAHSMITSATSFCAAVISVRSIVASEIIVFP